VIKKNPVLVGIILLSVVLRLGAAIYMGNTVVELPGTSDQVSYHQLSLRVLEGHGFTFAQDWWPATPAGEPTAHWSYLYTFYLMALYAVFGPNPIIARILQAILVGVFQPYLIYRLGTQLAGKTVALIAAALIAFYAYFIYYAGALMTEPFYITAILAVFTLAIQLAQSDAAPRKRIGLAIYLGLALGCVVLLRQLFLLFIPFLLVWLGWSEWKRHKTLQIQTLIITVTIIVLMIVPFTIFNYQRFGQFVLLNTNAGFAFFWGNHPIYGAHFLPILPPELGTYQDLLPKELLSLSEAALDKALMQRAMQFIIADPVRYILLSLSRIPAYFQFWPSSDSGLMSNLSRVASFGVLWPFMLYGLIRWAMLKGFRQFSAPDWLFLLFIVIYTGIHILSWALIRYRLPVDAFLIIFAGIAIQDLARRLHLIHPIRSETK
jgi:4-amino-4-deoxy-L-arabinose transferase-like glycosyltransferase